MLGPLALQLAALRRLPACSPLITESLTFYLADSRWQAALSTLAPASPLLPGASFSLTKQFSPEDVAAFVRLSGDTNPIHTSGEAARAAGLPGCVLPGMLSASLFPAIIGSTFPGAVYLSQTLKFKHYALVCDSLTATVEVDRASGSRVTFTTLCCNTANGRLLVEGTALALIPPSHPDES